MCVPSPFIPLEGKSSIPSHALVWQGEGGARSRLESVGSGCAEGGLGEKFCLLVARGTRPTPITARTSVSGQFLGLSGGPMRSQLVPVDNSIGLGPHDRMAVLFFFNFSIYLLFIYLF